MIRKRLVLLAAAAVLGLGACAGYGPTPYQAAKGGQGGFTETRIEPERYRVSFSGNSLTERETVENYLLFRAAEVTLQNGFDHFTVVKRDTDKSSRIQGDTFYPRFGYTYFHPRYGWISAWDPFWSPTSFREVTRYEASAEIVFGKGPKGGDPNAFDAREVTKNLAGSVTRPAQ